MIRYALFAVLLLPVQDDQEGKAVLKVSPEKLTLEVGESAQLEVTLTDADGKPLNDRILYFSRNRRIAVVDGEGNVTARRPGKATVIVRVARQTVRVVVTVPYPPLKRIEFVETRTKLYEKTTTSYTTRLFDTSGAQREEVPVRISSSDSSIATVDEFGNVTARAPGRFTLTAKAEKVEARLECKVIPNPVVRVDLKCKTTKCRTGDVLHFKATAFGRDYGVVGDAPIHFTLEARPDDTRGSGSTGQIEQDGRFVAEQPGLYTIVASCGDRTGRWTVRAEKRNVQRRLRAVGHGKVFDVHTSDLWVWEGVDGRDYAVTGTWGANGEAIFWDVTVPSKIKEISRVQVDARTVNDVKVSEDGKICVISREGASNRKNGIVIYDVTDPSEPEELATFTENLTGGVHNLFIYKKHVYALSAGRRYDVINIADPRKPHRVGSFELETPRHSIHDVWIEDGLAYSSNWRNGVQIVDVGNGITGGTPEKPVKVGSYAYPSGWNHAAFPYRSKGTGKFYVVAGDETFPYGLATQNKPTYPRGYFHFIDFTDMKNPKEVARYEVPEAGSHNLWVEGDFLYAAYYNGGLRVVDISGELMGDLYRQGREIAWFLPTHHEGKIPNASMVWGPQPFKGHIFFADWNTGLWAVKLDKVRG